MHFTFHKYQAAGNDFIMIDGEMFDFPVNDYTLIARLCHRHFGIGADGLILIDKEIAGKENFSMFYYNSDGKPGSLCGNGGRCAAVFAQQLGWCGSHVFFRAFDGLHEAVIVDENTVRLRMHDVHEISRRGDDYIMNTGSPHYVQFTENALTLNVYDEGRAIRNSESFIEKGINVNFATVAEENNLLLRTYERGVEDETLACGTGTVAAAIAYAHDKGITKGEIAVTAPGGNLQVTFEENSGRYTNIWLIGPVQKVFEGNWNE